MKFGFTHLSIVLWLGSGFLAKSHWALASFDNPIWLLSWTMAAAGIGLAILLGSPPSTRLALRPTERLAILSIVVAAFAAWLMGLGDGSLIHQTMMPISMLSSVWYGLWWFPRMVKRNGRLAEFPFTVYLVMAVSLVVLSPAFVDVRVALDPTVRENWLFFGITDAGLLGATAFAVACGSLLRKRFFGLRSLAFLLAALLVVTPWVRAGLAAAVVVTGLMMLRIASYGRKGRGAMAIQAMILVPVTMVAVLFLGGQGISGLTEKIFPEERSNAVEFREVAWNHFSSSLREEPFSLEGRGLGYKWTTAGSYTIWNDPHSTWAGLWEAGRMLTLGLFAFGMILLLGNVFKGSSSIPGFRAVLVVATTLTVSFAASALISATSPADRLFWMALGLLILEARRGSVPAVAAQAVSSAQRLHRQV